MRNMDRPQAAEFLGQMLDDQNMAESDIAASLTALTKKGATVPEILGFIDAMRARMTKIQTDIPAIDVCGTGGDKSGTFNISTTAAIVLAAGGVPVAKHGNRSASSKFGSADVLEALEIPVDSEPDQAAMLLKEKGFVFLFAQKYHPALKSLAVVRKRLGFPTVFNLLGPLLNPAGVKRQVTGTFSRANAELLAEVAANLNYEKMLVITGDEGLDEASLSGATHVIQLDDGQTKEYDIRPADFNLQPASRQEVSEGADAQANARLVIETLQPGSSSDARQRIVILNAALGFYVSGRAANIGEGVRLASEVLQDGRAVAKLKELRS